jgi:hypothetical protein
MPTRTTLINMGAEGGGTIGGAAAGYFATEAMNDYFKQHPAKNFGEQYGQALAAGLTGAIVGSLVQQVISATIRAGVSYAVIGTVEGTISSLELGPQGLGLAVAEAALYTTVAVTAQMTAQKQFEDAGYSHAFSRGMSTVVATGALSATNVTMWFAHGGPANPAADFGFLINEIVILGYGIYSLVTERNAGLAQDYEEDDIRAAAREAEKERTRQAFENIKVNQARQTFIMKLKENKK